jgi:UDPglucose--hexose-1-phosphate uridylyltransferase
VRVVPNLYPALARQEVVVHSPRHVRTFADLTDEELDASARAWRARAEALAPRYLHALVNEGRHAGASLAHSHSQLAWLGSPPPAVEGEADAVGELLDAAPLVAEHEGLVVVAHPAGRVPYELLLAPRTRPAHGAFADERLGAALFALRDAVRRIRAVEGAVPWNAWVHDGPWWHVEVVPRLTVFAGLELGAGIHVNVLDPAEAAESLRAASAA